MAKPRAYRGKYPSRIRTISTLKGRPGVVYVETNDGREFEATACALSGQLPKLGQDVAEWAGFVPFRRNFSRACALRAKFADKPVLAAYKAQRAHKLTRRDRTARTASAALSFARQDVESGRIASTPAVGVVTYQPDSPKRYAFAPRRRLAHVENPEAFGFRFVGYVTPESYGGRDSFRDTQEHGWLTDPCGDVFKDGSGLCTGVVYQLAGSRGESRFVAGYQFGGIDGGPTLDLSEVFRFGTADENDERAVRRAAVRAAVAFLRDNAAAPLPAVASLDLDRENLSAAKSRADRLEKALNTVYDGAAALGSRIAEGARLSLLKLDAYKGELDSAIGRAHDAAQREAVEAWRAGGRAGRFSDAKGGALVRAVGVERDDSGAIIGGSLQTSHGADVPLTHAVRAFRFLKLCRETGKAWDRNGRVIRVGHFTVDHVDADGSFKAGCHRINWPEVERLAVDLGVFDVAANSEALEDSGRH